MTSWLFFLTAVTLYRCKRTKSPLSLFKKIILNICLILIYLNTPWPYYVPVMSSFSQQVSLNSYLYPTLQRTLLPHHQPQIFVPCLQFCGTTVFSLRLSSFCFVPHFFKSLHGQPLGQPKPVPGLFHWLARNDDDGYTCNFIVDIVGSPAWLQHVNRTLVSFKVSLWYCLGCLKLFLSHAGLLTPDLCLVFTNWTVWKPFSIVLIFFILEQYFKTRN